MNRSDERVLALAGIIQCCYLVTGIARAGLVSEDSMSGSLESIFVTNPDETLDVYRSGDGVRTGLRLIMEILGDFRISEHGETVRYTLAIPGLEKRLRQSPDLLRSIGAGVSRTHEHRVLHEMPVTSEDIVWRLSDLYEETVGKLDPRILVQGQQTHLKNKTNTYRIRALLLAAIRSTVLWRQLDGHLAQLVLGRGKLLRSADNVSEILS